MPWQDILSGEVDTNSPITSSLMNKIKGNLEWLKSALVGWNVANFWGEEQVSGGPMEQWTHFKTIKIYIPSWASKLHFKIKGRVEGANTVKFRLKDADSSDTSGETGTAGSSWTWLSADWLNPPTGWRTIDIEYKASWNYYDVYVNHLAIIVSEAS